MPVQPVHPTRLYRQVAEQIARLIDSGEFGVGDRLPAERDLCVRLGVSRPSLREALIALEVEKVVEVRMGSGIYVLPPPLRREPLAAGTTAPAAAEPVALGPFDVVRARHLLEAEIVAQAARHASPEQIAAIGAALEQLRGCEVGRPEQVAGDRRFHLSLAEASGNPAYVLMLDLLWQHRTTPLYYQLENHFQSAAVWRKAMAEHEAIYAAVAARDASGAVRAMQDHLRHAENRMASKLD